MKKIIYIIPMLLLSIFLVNNVYGAMTNYTTVDELYNYFDTVDGMTYNAQRGVNSHEIVKQSELFINTKASYNYYLIYGGKVVFFNYIPTVPFFKLYDTSNIDIVYLALKFEVPNVNYVYFNFDMSTGAVTTGLYSNRVGADNYILDKTCDLGYINDFYTRDNFYNLFYSNFDLMYTDTGLPVVQKNPEFTFIPTYTENYESCNLKLDIKNAPDYYTLEYAINSSSSTWFQFDNSNGLTINDNCLVIVRMLDSNGDELFANSYTIQNIVKKPEFEFVPTYNEDKTYCNLKLNIIYAPNNYKLKYVSGLASTIFTDFDNLNGIDLYYNCTLTVLMLDENDNVIFTGHYTETNLSNELSSDKFKLNFQYPDFGKLVFTPVIYENLDENYYLYLNLSSEKPIIFRDNGGTFVIDTQEKITSLTSEEIDFNHSYYIYTDGNLIDFNFKLEFKLVNKYTGAIGLERSFTFNTSSFKKTQAVTSTTNGSEDKFFTTGGSDVTNLDYSINNPFSNINNNSSFEDIVSVAEESFTTFSALFSILPGFIWALVVGVIGILIVLRVLGR